MVDKFPDSGFEKLFLFPEIIELYYISFFFGNRIFLVFERIYFKYISE